MSFGWGNWLKLAMDAYVARKSASEQSKQEQDAANGKTGVSTREPYMNSYLSQIAPWIIQEAMRVYTQRQSEFGGGQPIDFSGISSRLGFGGPPQSMYQDPTGSGPMSGGYTQNDMMQEDPNMQANMMSRGWQQGPDGQWLRPDGWMKMDGYGRIGGVAHAPKWRGIRR